MSILSPVLQPMVVRAPRRVIAVFFGLLLALIVGVYLAGEIHQRKDYLPYFLEQKRALASVE